MISQERMSKSAVCFTLALVGFVASCAMIPRLGNSRALWPLLDALVAGTVGMVGAGIGAFFGHPFIGFFGGFIVLMACLFLMHAMNC
jgi:hypothetical protein